MSMLPSLTLLALTPADAAPVLPEALCSGDPAAQAYVEPVRAAHRVSPPRRTRHCDVHNTAELVDAVANCAYPDIVLGPGTYAPGNLSFLSFSQARRLWGTQPDTVLQFGISLGSHSGSALHGLELDVTPGHAVPVGTAGTGGEAAILFWGAASDTTIADTTVRGAGSVAFGIFGTNAEGLEVTRVGVEGFRRFGIRIDHPTPLAVPAALTDILVRDVGDPAWRAEPECDTNNQPTGCYAPGTAEHGIWLGAATTLNRAQVRDVWWAGVITGNCDAECVAWDAVTGTCTQSICSNAPLEDVYMAEIDVDRIGVASGPGGAGVGIAFERVTRDASVLHFCVGPQTERGVHAEWNHGDPAQSAEGLSVTKGHIASDTVGVFFDSGTHTSFLEDLEIEGASWAGIGLSCCAPADPDTCTTNTLGDHITTTLPPTACDVAKGPYLGACACSP